jgi:hypothetical protein
MAHPTKRKTLTTHWRWGFFVCAGKTVLMEHIKERLGIKKMLVLKGEEYR